MSPWTTKGKYLNTASVGIPPAVAAGAVREVSETWAQGELEFRDWLAEAQLARAAVARLLNVQESQVALGTATSALLGSIAASLPDGAHVLAPVNEHNSNLIPYLRQAHRGVTVELVPLAQLAASIQDSTALVSCSAVQSFTGEVADLPALRQACREKGAILCLDVSQACGWLPLSGDSADVLVCSMYKWLCAPVGSAFLVMRPELIERFSPITPSWVAASDPFAPPYGTDFQPAAGAAKFDTVPNLVSLIGARYSIETILGVGVENIQRHNLTLANHFRAGLRLPPSNSAIVSIQRPGAAQQLARVGIRATEWQGNLRLSFHIYNSRLGVEHALGVLREAGRLER